MAAFGTPEAAHAAIITWDGGGLTGNWSDAVNWSTNTIPGAADTAVFNATSAKPAAIALANVNVGGVQVDATYGGSITQGAGRTITVGAAGWTQAGSTFSGSAAAITMNGPFSLSGGTFTSTTGILTLAGALTQAGGTFLHASGTVRFTGPAAAIDVPGSMSLWNVNFAHNNAVPKTIAAGDTLVVSGLLTLTNGSLDVGTVAARGDLLQTSTFDGGTGTLLIDGGGDQTFSGTATTAAGQLPNLVIDKTGGTLSLAGIIRTARDWTYLGGSLAAGTSSVVFAGTQTIAGDHSLFNVEFRSALAKTIATGSTLGVDGLLTLTDGDLNDGTVEARGNITAAAALDGETATLRIAGSGDQTFTGAATATTGELPNIVIDKPSGTVTLAGTLRVFSGAWTFVAGVLDPGASTVVFDTGAAISGDHTLFNVVFRGGAHAVAVGDTLVVSGLLTLTNGTVDDGTVAARGDLLQASTFDGGTGTLLIDGGGDQTFSGTATTTAGQLPNLVVDKPSGTLTLAGTIRTTNDWTHLAGTLDPGASNVVFAGVLTVTMNGAPLFRVQVHGGATMLGAPLITLDDLDVTAGTLSTSGQLVDVDGDLLVTGTLDGGGSEIHVAGEVTISGTFDPGGGRLTLDGTALQTLATGSAVLADLTVANPAGAVLASDVTVQGVLDLASGTLTIGPLRLTIAMPIVGTPTNLAADATSSITIAGSSADIRVPASVTDLAELAIANPLGVAIDGPLAIHATLVLAGGNLDAGPHLVSIEAGGGVVRTSGHVIGSLRKAVSAGGPLSVVFEIGDASGYTPIDVSWPSVGTTGKLTASTLGADPLSLAASGLDPAASVNRTWTLVPESLSAEPFSVNLTFLAAEVDPGLDPNSTLGAAFDGVTWTLPPVSARSATSVALGVPTMGVVSFGAAMPAADLAITLTGPTSVVVGVVSTYEAIVSNDGPFAAPAAVVAITLPNGTILGSVAPAAGTCSVVGQTITCDLGPLAVGGQVTISIRLSFGAAGVHVLTAAVSIGSGASDPSPADDIAELRVTAAEPVAAATPPGTPGTLPDTAGGVGAASMLIGIALLAGLIVLAGVPARARRGRARR